VTRNLSQAEWILGWKGGQIVSDTTCPWCEASVELAPEEATEQQCPECLTTWCYEDTNVELPLAA
jgi:hypothetical protein